MRTTIDIPENLVNEAMKLTNIPTKSGVIKEALQNLIQKEKVKGLKKFSGKVDLKINLDSLRKR
jgi:Arc/MetJ family transcription regulator